MVQLAPGSQYRVSKRGLLLAAPTGDTVLFEHPHAADLPALLSENPELCHLQESLGAPLHPDALTDLLTIGVLTDGETKSEADGAPRRVTFSRAGVMIAGIDRPARWLDTHLVPALIHPFGLVTTAAVLIVGAIAFVSGRPDLPAVSDNPAMEAVLMIVIGMAATVCHELAHAVALVHYGRTPRRAGFGFYWGAVSFFVDSTPALTLPRNQRVVQALIGLAVDVVTTAAFAIAAHLSPSPLLAIVFWRLAILSLVDIAINLAPVLQVDGHWALADWLDEPDLGPRARSALGAALRRQLPVGQRWLATYGAISLLAGLTLLGVLAAVFWATTHDLVISLFAGNVVEIALGVYYIGPLALGMVLSVVGLLLETLAADRPAQAAHDRRLERGATESTS